MRMLHEMEYGVVVGGSEAGTIVGSVAGATAAGIGTMVGTAICGPICGAIGGGVGAGVGAAIGLHTDDIAHAAVSIKDLVHVRQVHHQVLVYQDVDRVGTMN